jgi:hypothetical protein
MIRIKAVKAKGYASEAAWKVTIDGYQRLTRKAM